MAAPGNFTTLAASGAVTFSSGATSGYYWTCSNGSGLGLWTAPPTVGQYSSINLTSGATIGKVWQCTDSITGAGAWVSVASLSTGGAFTISNDTNITATLTGSSTTALFTPITLNLAWSGVLPVSRGGTGYNGASLTLGDLLYASNGSVTTRLPGNTTTTRKFLISQGNGATAAAPFWDIIQGSDIGSIVTSFTSAGFGIAAQSNSHIATSNRTGVAGVNYQIALGGLYTAINTTTDIKDLDITTTHKSSATGLISSEGISIETNLDATLGTITEHCSLHIHAGTNAGGTVTTAYGAHIMTPTYGVTNYALWTEDVTIGSATPWSLLALDANNKVTSIAPYSGGFGTYVLTWTGGTSHPTWQAQIGGGGGGSGITSATGTANQILINGTAAAQTTASTFTLATTLIAPGSVQSTTTMAIVSAISSTAGLLNGFAFTGAAGSYYGYNSTGTFSLTSSTTAQTAALNIANIISTSGATVTLGAGIINSPTLRNTSGTFTTAYAYYSKPIATGTTTIGTYATLYLDTPTATGTLTTTYTAYFAAPPTAATASVAVWADSIQIGGTIASTNAGSGNVNFGSSSISATSLLATDSSKNLTTTTSAITPTFAGIVLGTLSGILKATTGTVGTATAGTDYEPPITAGTAAQYFKGNKTLGTFSTDVQAQISASGNLSYSTGNVTLNTTITGLTSVSSTTFVGALTGNSSTATALSTAGAANQFWKNGNVWAQPTQADISGLTTGSSPTFTGLTLSGLASGDVLAYFNTSKALSAVTLSSNLTLTTGTLALNTTISGLTSVSSTSFTGALTGNASTATALSTSGAANQFWKNGNVWAQPTQADISGLTTASSPSFTGVTLSGATASTLTYFDSGKALSSVTLNSNLTLTTGTLALNTTISGLTSVSSTGFTGALTGNASTATALSTSGTASQFWTYNNTWAQPTQADISGLTTSSNPQFNAIGIGVASPSTAGYAQINSRLGLASTPSATIGFINNISFTGAAAAYYGESLTSSFNFSSGTTPQTGVLFIDGTAANITTSGGTISTLASAIINNVRIVNSSGTLAAAYGYYTKPTITGTSTIGSYAAIYVDAPTITGTVTTAYGSYVKVPTGGGTNVASYTDNLAIGTAGTAPPASGLLVSGPIKNTNVIASTILYADSSQQLASVTLNSNLTLTTGTLALNTTISGLTSVSSTSFTGALTGNASTATALSTSGAANQFWKSGNVWAQPTQADISGLTTGSSPSFTGLTISGLASGDVLAYFNTSKALAAVTLNSNLTLTSGTLALNTTISGLTSVSSTGFTGALTGNASTATALSTSGAANQFWKNGNVWAQPTQADISGLTTGSSPSFTGLTISGATGDTLTYFNTSKALTSVTLSSNLTLTTGTLDTVQGIQTTSNPQFNSLGIGIAAPATTGYARINVRLGVAMAPSYPFDVTGQSRLSSSLSLNGATPNNYTALDIGTGFTATGSSSSYGANISGTLVGGISGGASNIYGINVSSVLKLPSSAPGGSECAAIKLTPSTDANTFTIAALYGIYIATGTNVSGTVTVAYGSYTKVPTAGTTNIASYTDNMAIGTTGTAPPTNGLLVSGPIKNTNVTASTLMYADASQQLASVTLNSNITLTAGTLALNTTISGLTSVSSTGFTGALTGNASTATALSTSGTASQFWTYNNTWAQPTQADISGLTTSSSPTFTGLALSGTTIWAPLIVNGSNAVTSVTTGMSNSGWVLTSNGTSAAPTWQAPTGSSGGVSSVTGTANQILINGGTSAVTTAATFTIDSTFIAPGSIKATTTIGIAASAPTDSGLLNNFTYSGTGGTNKSIETISGSLTFTTTTTSVAAGLLIMPTIATTTAAILTVAAGIYNNPTFTANSSNATSNFYGTYNSINLTNTQASSALYTNYNNGSITLTANLTNYYGNYVNGAIASGTGTLANMYGNYVDTLTKATGTVTIAYGSYTKVPTAATTNIASYTDNMAIGTAGVAPPASGLLVSGPIKNTNVTASTILYADASQQLASVTLDSNLTLTAGTLALNTTISGLTSVSSTGFTGALTGNASTATALSTAGAANQFWKNGNVWAQPTQADISGLTTSSSPSFTGVTVSGATADTLTYFNTSKALTSVTLNSNITLTTGTLALNTTISGLTSVSSTTFVGALTGNASTATALSTSGAANQFWKNGNVWAQPTQADISGLTTASSPSFTGVTLSGATGDTLTYFNTSKALTSTTLSSNLTLTTGTLDTVQGIQTTSNPQFNSLGIGTAAPTTTGYARINVRLGIAMAPSYPLDITGQSRLSSSLSLNGATPNTYTALDVGTGFTATGSNSSYGANISGTLIGAVSGAVSNMYGINVSSVLKLPSAAPSGSECATIKLTPSADANTFTITTLYGLYIATGTNVSGTVTTAYGSYVKVPTAGTTNIASYTDNMAIGTTGTAPPASGLLVSGPIKNTNVTASTLMYADASQQLASVTLNSNLTLTTGTLALNTTISGLTSVSSTGFTGALTGNASTATALSTSGAANQFWKNGNVWAQPTQADISGLTTGSSPSFTGVTVSGATASTLTYFDTGKALASVTLNSNLTLTTGTLALNTTISGLTSVSSTTFVGALTGNASTATALSTSGAANQFWKNGNVWAQPTQADISGLTTSSSPSFTGVTVSGATGDTLTYFNTSKALTSATLSSNLTLTTGTLDTVQGIQTTSNPQFNSLGIGTTAPGTAGYARINTRLGIGGAPSYPLDVTGQVKFSSSLSLNGSVPNTYTMFDMNMDYTTSATGDSYGMAINGTMISAVLANTSNSYAIYVNPLLRLAAAASGGSEYACIKVAPKFDANTFTIANVYGLYIIAGVGYTGTITTAYGSYVKVPTAGTTNIASYTDNMAIGTAATAPPTNGLLVSGPIKNTNVTASTLMYADASQQLASVTLNSNLTLTTGTLALNTTISGLTSVSSTGFTGALTGNASTATALSTAGSANQFWKNGNVWAQPTQADISGLTTGSSPSFTGITLSGATGDTLTYFNTSKALTSATLSSNLTLTTGTLDTVQGIQTTSNPQFNSLGIGTAAPATTGYARINVRLGIAMAPTYPLDVTGQSRLSSSLSLNGATPNTYTALDIGTGFTATGASSSYGANISGTLVGAVSAATCNIYGINISSVLKLPSSATSECAGIKITPSTDANTFTIANSYGLYIAAGSNVSGTVTTAYGGYFAAPGFGTTKIALWANDITLNTATAFAPLATDTNKNVVSLTTGISNVGWVLTSTGASSVPTWQAVSGGSGVPSVTGTANQILINGGTSAVTTAATFTIPSSFIAPGSIQSTLTMGVGMAVSTDFGINLNYTYSGAIPFYTGGVHVTGTITVTGGTADTIAGVYIEPTFDFQSSTSSITAGIYSAPWFKATAGSSHSWYGIHNAPFLTNTGASDYYYGYFSDTAINLVSNLSAIYGIASNIRVTAGSGTITNAYNIYVDLTSKLSGTVTTAYGLYVNNPTAGTTNIALYSANANLNYVGVAPPTGGMIMSGKLGVGNNNPTNQLEVTGTARFSSSVICATGALATTATDGYIYIPSCAGIPTGVPTSQTGTCAMAYDTTNNDLYIYDGTWQKATLNASDVSFESINNNEACYAYSITYDGSNRYSTITYTAPGGNIVKTFSYNGDGTINTIVLSGAGLPTIAYTTKTYTYTSGSLTSVAYS